MHPRTLIPVFALFGVLGGCSGLVRRIVDTQPRSTISAEDLAHPDQVVNGRVVGYLPSARAEDEGGTRPDDDLLRFAPVLIQGIQRGDAGHTRYALTDDAIGSPYITANERTTKINTDEPTLYWHIEHASVDGQTLKQLVYVFWYPRRPVGSIETGAIDGGVLRITLDSSDRPAVFEYAQTCGCYHGVFVAGALERSAQAQFGVIEAHREHAVERAITGHDDWVVRDVIEAHPGTRPALFLSAGKHFLVDIASLTPEQIASLTSDASRTYTLAPYKALDGVPRVGGGVGSIFNKDGLVKGARRGREQLVMGDLDHAGWPRRLAKMHIHWDADRWTDPDLLARHLRLPDAIVSDGAHRADAGTGPSPSVSLVSDPSSPTASSRSVRVAGSSSPGRRLLLFTDTRCVGCQLTKQIMHDSDEIHEAMDGWGLTVIDTATSEGARLAAERRITLVPTLVGIDHEHELMRSDALESKGAILNAIGQITLASEHL